MIYKNGPRFKVRPVADIKKDIDDAKSLYGQDVHRIFLPAGNTIAMKTDNLCAVCEYAISVFPNLDRITVYGSSQYIHKKGLKDLKRLASSGLSRIHVGLESGDDEILKRIEKGTSRDQQIKAGQWVMAAGIELSVYVVLGIGGTERTQDHTMETARALNEINPDFIRLRTFVPKINTPLLDDVLAGRFVMLSPHEVLSETTNIIEKLTVSSYLASDHYTNYVNIEGQLSQDKKKMLETIAHARKRDESEFRPFFVGEQ